MVVYSLVTRIMIDKNHARIFIVSKSNAFEFLDSTDVRCFLVSE